VRISTSGSTTVSSSACFSSGDDSIADRVALLSRYVREQLDDRVHRGVAHYRALVAERARQRLDRLGVVRLPERAGGDAPE